MFQKKHKEKPTSSLGKVWYFIWEDDSVWSWLLNIVLAFVIIKFLVYPGLGLVLGTQNPIVAVVSGSMEHDGSFDEWWQSDALCGTRRCTQEQFYSELEISKDEFRDFHFKNGFNVGDIIFLTGREAKDIKIGDVLVFDIGNTIPIIHRSIDKWQENGEYYFTTKGDHNFATIPQIGENQISEKQIIGRAWFRIPWLGYVKIGFVKLLDLIGII